MKTRNMFGMTLLGLCLTAMAGTAAAGQVVVNQGASTVIYDVVDGRQQLVIITRHEAPTVTTLWTKIERIRMNQNNTAPEVHEEVTEFIPKTQQGIDDQVINVARGGYGGGSGWVSAGSTSYLGSSGCYGSCGGGGGGTVKVGEVDVLRQ